MWNDPEVDGKSSFKISEHYNYLVAPSPWVKQRTQTHLLLWCGICNVIFTRAHTNHCQAMAISTVLLWMQYSGYQTSCHMSHVCLYGTVIVISFGFLKWVGGVTQTAKWSHKFPFIFSLLSLFWKNKRRLMRSTCCQCLCIPPPKSWKLGTVLFIQLQCGLQIKHSLQQVNASFPEWSVSYQRKVGD
jgi:hypothetical protein